MLVEFKRLFNLKEPIATWIITMSLDKKNCSCRRYNKSNKTSPRGHSRLKEKSCFVHFSDYAKLDNPQKNRWI